MHFVEYLWMKKTNLPKLTETPSGNPMARAFDQKKTFSIHGKARASVALQSLFFIIFFFFDSTLKGMKMNIKNLPQVRECSQKKYDYVYSYFFSNI